MGSLLTARRTFNMNKLLFSNSGFSLFSSLVSPVLFHSTLQLYQAHGITMETWEESPILLGIASALPFNAAALPGAWHYNGDVGRKPNLAIAEHVWPGLVKKELTFGG